MDNAKNERATKKQQELLSFIDGFIKGNGYGPSYREVMRALGYKSVSTVATHVDALIAKGYLAKTDTSARSLTVLRVAKEPTAHTAWLTAELQRFLCRYTDDTSPDACQSRQAIERVAALFDITL